MRDSMLEILPQVNAFLNVVITALVIAAFLAVRRGDRQRHARLMKAAVAVGVLFLIGYGTVTAEAGHQRFPGEGWLRVLFLTILIPHTILAVALVPMIGRTILLAIRNRIDEHRRWARYTLPAWLFVCITGIMIYSMITLTG